MDLPVISTPTYEFEIPSSKKIIKYRPFLVKEQKVLLMALESKDDTQILSSVKQIASNCILDKDFDISSLAPFDLQYFFLQLRGKSIGEIVSTSYRCTNSVRPTKTIVDSTGNNTIEIITDPAVPSVSCNNIVKIEYNISEAKIETVPEHSNKIYIDGTIGITMKYPSLDLVAKISKNLVDKTGGNHIDNVFSLIVECIDYIFDKDTVYLAKDSTKEDLVKFLENLSQDKFEKIENFFETMPTLKQTLEKECSKCGFKHTIVLEGLQSFFD